MRTEIKATDFTVSSALQEHARRRAHFALGRLSHSIERLVITLEDVNGPQGGVDKKCTVQAILRGSNPVVVHETHADMYGAIGGALARIGLSVGRHRDLLTRRVRVRRLNTSQVACHESASRGVFPI